MILWTVLRLKYHGMGLRTFITVLSFGFKNIFEKKWDKPDWIVTLFLGLLIVFR